MARDRSSPYIFEASWEVCNQVGGIYTVLRTKAHAMRLHWGSRYIMLGPLQPDSASLEFEETRPNGFFREVLAELEAAGVRASFGRWLVEGRPQTILFDLTAAYSRLEELRHYLRQDHGLSPSPDDEEINNAIAFGFTVADFLRVLAQRRDSRPMVVHCHEWQAGLVVSRVRFQQLAAATIFTTHATLLGRYMAGDNPSFYTEMHRTQPHECAVHYGIEGRFLFERAAAQDADIFTTVSEITASESRAFLGRKPEFILPNGLNVQRFIALHEFQNLHLKYKEKIHEFVMAHFFPSYTFDLNRTLYFFLSGRYEYRNKGMDYYIDALERLNRRLKTVAEPPTIVAFIVTRAPARSMNVEALRFRSMFEDLRRITLEMQPIAAKRTLAAVASGRFPDLEDLLPADFRLRFRRAMHARRTKRHPAMVTHDLLNEEHDPVLQHLRRVELLNSPEDPVKVIYHPEFLTETSLLFSLDYDHFVRGNHLGIFPSFYEPWGYTPLECVVHGIPTVTTDCSGFGQFVMRTIPNYAENGIYVLRRRHHTYEEAVEELADLMFVFSQTSRRERIELRNRVERLSETFDWAVLARHYFRAQEEAAARAAAKRQEPGPR